MSGGPRQRRRTTPDLVINDVWGDAISTSALAPPVVRSVSAIDQASVGSGVVLEIIHRLGVILPQSPNKFNITSIQPSAVDT